MKHPEKSRSHNPGPDNLVSIKILGVGDAGGRMVEHLAQSGLAGVAFAVLNTDAQALAAADVPEKLLLGSAITRELGTGGEPERGQAAAEEAPARLDALCKGTHLIIILAGLGGGTGTGASPAVARAAKAAGALVLAVVTLPFDFEGSRRQRQARHGLQRLRVEADAVVCLPNQKLFKLVDQQTNMTEGLRFINQMVGQGVCGLWRLLTRPGLIKVAFPDLCEVLRGQHAESALATAEARGPNRARDALDQLLAHPMLDGGQSLSDADSVLVSLAGGLDLTPVEIEKVMEPIHRQCEKAQVIMGAAMEADYEDRLMITLIASRHAAKSRLPSPPPASPAKEEPQSAPPKAETELEPAFLEDPAHTRPSPRFVPPPPELTSEARDQILAQQTGTAPRQRKRMARLRQGQLPLEIVSKGRFEKSEPTIHHGEDLDVPTYIRRGVALN